MLRSGCPIGDGFPAYAGDLHDPDLDFAGISAAVSRLIGETLPDMRTSLVRRVYAGGRTLWISITDDAADLRDASIRSERLTCISDLAWRFGWDRSCPASDLIDRHFSVVAEVHADYWSQRQARREGASVASTMTPAALLRKLRPGHVLVDTSRDRRYVVRASDASGFRTDDGRGGADRIRWRKPRNAALRCDGRVIRISKGSERDPDDHVLLDWTGR